MRFVLCILLAILPGIALADELTCYSNGKMIYSGYGHMIDYMDGMISFEDIKNKKAIFITGDCVVKIKV